LLQKFSIPFQVSVSEPYWTFIARQRLCKHVPAATNTQATTEALLGNGRFSLGPAPWLYHEDPKPTESVENGQSKITEREGERVEGCVQLSSVRRLKRDRSSSVDGIAAI
jgi:hypothetical protein